ncbi:TIR domain-containing protein [Shewanella vesiculosa]|uniref:TIR domain-containing protein n=1 Tax=Shewanella vesiculosa TaxID=518738 RepID=UPI003D07BF28
MDKQEIIDGLESLTNRLVVDVTKAFEDRGEEFGEQRYIAWRKKLYAFFKQNLPQSINDFNALFSPYEIFQPDYLETHLDFFIRSKGNKIFSFLESLRLDLENDEYDFTPLNKEVKQVTTLPDKKAKAKSNKVFIVHGHDGETKYRTANFLRQHDLDPIILHLKASRNRTIIEKLEKYTEDVGYGIVLYTPDDLGQVKSKASNGELDNRARQNVIFEHGYLMGLIGRENVVAIVKGDIELPNDISGVVYIDDADWEKTLLIELRDAGYALNIANL